MSIKIKNLSTGDERTYGAAWEEDGRTPKREECSFRKDVHPGFVLRVGPTMGGNETDYEIKLGLVSAIWIYCGLRAVFERDPGYIASAAAYTDDSLNPPGMSEEERTRMRTCAAIKMVQDLIPGTGEHDAAEMLILSALTTRSIVDRGERLRGAPSPLLVASPVADDAENEDDDEDEDDDEE